MPLRRTSVTPRSLAARRANALKSTGPRSARGKARVSLNALKGGRFAALAGRSARLRQQLLEAGHRQEEALYGAIRTRIAQAFGARTPEGRSVVDRLAIQVWCFALGRRRQKTKLETPLESVIRTVRVSSEREIDLGRLMLRDPWTRVGLIFWRQRKRYYTMKRLEKRLLGLEEPCEVTQERKGASSRAYESALRSLVFRIRKPGAVERSCFGLQPNGDPDWEREPWKGLSKLKTASQEKQVPSLCSEQAGSGPASAAEDGRHILWQVEDVMDRERLQGLSLRRGRTEIEQNAGAACRLGRFEITP